MNAVHKTVLTLSFGKIGGNLLGMPAFEVTTIGRKSGEPRKVMLTSPYQEGDTTPSSPPRAATTSTRPGT